MVLEKVMVSDLVDRDVIFAMGINVTGGGGYECTQGLKKVHRDSIYGVEDGDVGTRLSSEGFSVADF